MRTFCPTAMSIEVFWSTESVLPSLVRRTYSIACEGLERALMPAPISDPRPAPASAPPKILRRELAAPRMAPAVAPVVTAWLLDPPMPPPPLRSTTRRLTTVATSVRMATPMSEAEKPADWSEELQPISKEKTIDNKIVEEFITNYNILKVKT